MPTTSGRVSIPDAVADIRDVIQILYDGSPDGEPVSTDDLIAMLQQALGSLGAEWTPHPEKDRT